MGHYWKDARARLGQWDRTANEKSRPERRLRSNALWVTTTRTDKLRGYPTGRSVRPRSRGAAADGRTWHSSRPRRPQGLRALAAAASRGALAQRLEDAAACNRRNEGVLLRRSEG